MEQSLNYSNVYLIPKYSELRTRTDADVSTEFLGRKFKLPIVPANMVSVINLLIAKWLSENDYFYIYHRFGQKHDHPINFVRYANKEKWKTISISVGVKKEDKDIITGILWEQNRVDVLTIDVAHGHHILVKEMIKFIKDQYKEQKIQCPKIIAGNVCTRDATRDLKDWGADAIKIGIAGGGACSTKNQTGFHVPMIACINSCNKIGIPIIADGGVKENGDIAKALVGGSSMVMIGGVLASCIDSPAENITEPVVGGFVTDYSPKITHKKYFGSASYANKGHSKNVEGVEIDIPCNGLTFEQKYQEIKESLQSAISYSGGKELKDLRNVQCVIV